MKKFINISKKIIVNIIIAGALLYLAEFIIWGCENLRIKYTGEQGNQNLPVSFHPEHRFFQLPLDFFPQAEYGWGRDPDGTEYSSRPLAVFGCSFAYGFNLDKNQTFSYKLSELTKRPVYNRAASGWGIQHMLFQLRQKKFYEKVPDNCECVFFVMIKDHFRRLYAPTFMSTQLLERNYNLRYVYKDGELILPEKNEFLTRLTDLYLIQKIQHAYINNVILRKSNSDEYFDFALKHFIASKNELKKHMPEARFIIVIYQYFDNYERFIKKLKDNGFEVIYLPSLTDANLNSPPYLKPDYHPSEEAWDLVTPIIIKETGL